jgi:hypothetical protein
MKVSQLLSEACANDAGPFSGFSDVVIDAWTRLTSAEQDSVSSYSGTFDCREILRSLAIEAAESDRPLYLRAGLWQVHAHDQSHGWHIDLEANQSLLVFGDGDATIIRRAPHPDEAGFNTLSSIVWIAANRGIHIAFHRLKFDGNEANCPTKGDVPVSPAGGLCDGVTKIFTYVLPAGALHQSYGTTLTLNGVEYASPPIEFVKQSKDGNPVGTRTFAEPPPVGSRVRVYQTNAYGFSANVQLKPGTGGHAGKPACLILDRVTMTGCVADGLRTREPIERLRVTHFRSFGRTRRPRLDIHLGPPPDHTFIKDFVGDSLASEDYRPGTLQLEDVTVRGNFYITNTTGALTVDAQRLNYLGEYGAGPRECTFRGAVGTFKQSYFRRLESIRNCRVTFEDCTIGIGGLPLDASRSLPLRITLHERTVAGVVGDVVFRDTVFMPAPGVEKGSFVDVIYGESWPWVAPDRARFINCIVTRHLDYFADMQSQAALTFFGGAIGGRIAALQLFNKQDVEVDNPGAWTSTLFRLGRNIESQTFDIVVRATGAIDAERNAIVERIGSAHIGHVLQWGGILHGSVVSEPNNHIRGVPNLELVERDVSGMIVRRWRYISTTTTGEMAYQIIP